MIGGAPIAGFPIAGTITYGSTPTTPVLTGPLMLLIDRDGRTVLADTQGRAIVDVWIKKGDTSPALTGQVLDGTAGANLDGATVRFVAKDRTTGAVAVNAAATVDDAATGLVRYAWQATDTAEEAELLGEFEVTFADGVIQSWPTPGFIAVHVTADTGA